MTASVVLGQTRSFPDADSGSLSFSDELKKHLALNFLAHLFEKGLP